MRAPLLTYLALVMVLGSIAAAAPRPWFLTDEPVYERTAHQFVIADCSDIQCFRLLAPWLVGRLPGSSAFRWKTYAVLAIAGAALATGRFCVVAGLTPRAAQLAIWLVALGCGPLLTLYNPFSPDPLMYLLGPIVATELWLARRGRAALVAMAGVFGKEVAAAPLWIFFAWSVLRRQWGAAARTLAVAIAATLVWIWLQLWLMIHYNYSYAGNKSADMLHGGDLVVWLGVLGPRAAALALLGSFGGLLLLVPAGLARASRELRLLALAALPAAIVLCYVQQPDRALWNYHYVFIPFAVLALEAAPAALGWLFVACYGLSNLRVGAQLALIPAARYTLLASLAVAAAAVVIGWRRPAPLASIAAEGRA